MSLSSNQNVDNSSLHSKIFFGLTVSSIGLTVTSVIQMMISAKKNLHNKMIFWQRMRMFGQSVAVFGLTGSLVIEGLGLNLRSQLSIKDDYFSKIKSSLGLFSRTKSSWSDETYSIVN
jgi:hypothetical protein